MVIAIIGILAGMIIVALGTARQKARDARRKSDLENLRKALEFYNSDNQVYVASNTCADVTNTADSVLKDLKPTYIRTVPTDPTPGQTYCYASDAARFVIWAKLENVDDQETTAKSGKTPLLNVPHGDRNYFAESI